MLQPARDVDVSDEDDAGSDVEGDIRDLGRGVLARPAEIRRITSTVTDGKTRQQLIGNDGNIVSSHLATEQSRPTNRESAKKRKKVRKWDEIVLEPMSSVQQSSECEPFSVQDFRRINATPVDIFRTIFDDELVDRICRETAIYAMQKGSQIQVCHEDVYKYIAVLLLSGYCRVPHRDMYWEQRPDTHNLLVSNAMKRGPFRELHRFLHFNDNSHIDNTDRVYKVRTVIQHLNEKFQEMIKPLGKKISIDEAMEPYFGKHYMKQFIRGKPIRYGFKFWCLCTPGGYLIKFHPYVGANETREPGQTLGASVVQRLCSGFIPHESIIFIDNFFSSIGLLESLKDEQIYVIGTIRSDRIEKAPLENLQKRERGSYHALREKDSGVTLVRWNDNSQVTVATNLNEDQVKGLTTCKRWSRVKKDKVSLPMPILVKDYNKYMGGVDLFDRLRGLYRTRIRNKRWYYPIFRFCLNGAVVNAWLLYRHLDKEMSLVEFTRRIVIAVLSTPAIEKPRGVRPKNYKQVLHEVRYDNTGHLVNSTKKQRKCAQCKKCTTFECIKCNVGLHPKACFVLYHTKR